MSRDADLERRVLAFGDWASRRIRDATAPLAPPLLRFAVAVRRSVSWLQAEASPLRGVIAVTGIAAIVLAVSQFVDYRGVAIGASDYAYYGDVEAVAPAPQVDRKPAGSAHAYVLLPLALAALGALVACLRGRWQLARAISLLGLVAIGVSLLVDIPAGLDVSGQEVEYSGVEAVLVEGFYLQLSAACVLVLGGLLMQRYARAAARSPGRARQPTRAAQLAASSGAPRGGARPA